MDVLLGDDKQKNVRATQFNRRELVYLANRFRQGIARAIGVPPEYIDEEKVRKWVENWVKAFVKPEYWERVLSSPGGYESEWLGYELGSIISESFSRGAKK